MIDFDSYSALAHCDSLASIPRGYGSGDTSLVEFRASDELSTGTYMQYGFAQRQYELLSERNFYDDCFPLILHSQRSGQ